MNRLDTGLQTLQQWTHLSSDALLIYCGLIIFFLAALCHQRQLKSKYAIWAVLGLALAAELFGARHDILDRGYWRVGESLRDILCMSLMPLLLWLGAHYRIWRY
ncbi:hypothetical protein [Acinetobacter tianfuensis]|uniref:Uncharacterized protein n=1 Tax=Acinetobacter tianfuensis TaxID=2419603 RepID=A0A3A8ESD6_9GAMM|nr:hypothetical protein [Acinetobacter tianfuensis]RKG31791.1 hypothetical protein D7V32_07565 [Acinetobacter tianfuensis]